MSNAVIQEFLGNPSCLHTADEKVLLFEKAETEKSFASLVGYPCVMFLWQARYPQDIRRISTISSHILGKRLDSMGKEIPGHIYCDTKEKCDVVEKFIHDNMPGQKELL